MGEVPVAVIRTSDRSNFRRCRRKWNWSSHLRQNLESENRPGYFWFGTGCHFAMEDWHGHNRYGHPAEAFLAFIEAHKRAGIPLPDDVAELTELGVGMLSYYLEWCQHREQFETLWIDDEPQCEVNIQIELPFDPVKAYGPVRAEGFEYKKVHYSLTIDRVALDPTNSARIWLTDYKFMKSFQDEALDTNDQITSYWWGAQALYPDYEIAGFIFQQHVKKVPKEPEFLSSGRYTHAKNRLGSTTHRIYRRCLEELYGNPNAAPAPNIDALAYLAMQESEDRDAFIRRERVYRNESEISAMGEKIMMETEDMLNPDIALYPNSTKDCGWDCSFREACIAMDRDDDWEGILQATTVDRKEASDSWRHHLK